MSSDNFVAVDFSHACSAAILAGGRARRMGGSAKGLMLVGAETIKSRQLRTLTAVGLRTLFVVGKSDARYAPLRPL